MALPQPDPADPLRDALREWAQASAELAQTARDYLDSQAKPGAAARPRTRRRPLHRNAHQHVPRIPTA